MGGCQNYGPFLGTLNTRCRNIIRTQKGTLILTTTHMWVGGSSENYSLGFRGKDPASQGPVLGFRV